MTLESIGIILSVAGLSKDVYDLVKKDDHIKEIDKAYNRALKKWCKNDSVREKIATRFKRLSDLHIHIQENKQLSSIDPEYASFLVVWESELRSNALTYGHINEILARQGVSIGKDILSRQEIIADKVDIVGEDVKEVKQDIKQGLGILMELQDNLPKLISAPQFQELRFLPQFKPPQYLKQDDYIIRRVRDYNNVDNLTIYLNPQSYEPKLLIDYLITDTYSPKIILYSEAQAGKTIEILNLAYETQNSELFNVYQFDLKQYVGGLLSDYVHLDYLISEPSKRNLLILDGLDEINDERRLDAIHQIEYLASEYNNISMIVTCRGNFESTNEVAGFKKLYLNSLDFNDVKIYVQSKCAQPEKLLDTVEQKDLYNLVYNPFYLKTITEYYGEKGKLPETKPEIYDYVISKSLQIDQRRAKGRAIPVRNIAMPLLEKIAFCMQFTEQSSFTYKELTQGLSLSEENVIACTNYTIFKMHDGDYSFTHNAFKEYLTAKHLSGISFEKLKTVICYPNTDILRPNLYNTVILLVSILNENDPLVEQLIGWLAEHKPEVLFMCENHFMTEDRKLYILKGYLEGLKKYGEYVPYNAWERTMAFANNRESILYLVEEAKEEKELSCHVSNTITLLEFADVSLLSKIEQDELYELGLQLIGQNKTNKDIQHLMFHIPGNRHFRKPERIAQLHSVIKDCDNPTLLNEFFRLVQEAELADDYIDWIISKKECIQDYHSKGVTHLVRKESLVDVLTSVKKIEGIIKSLSQFDLISGIHFDGDKCSDIISRVFSNLDKVPPVEITNRNINKLLTLLESESLTNFFHSDTSNEIVKGYRDFLFRRGYDEAIFMDYYATLKCEILTPTLNDVDKSAYIYICLNVLSTVMTKERFTKIMSDNAFSEDQRFWWILNPLGNYEIIWSNDEWNHKIQMLKTKYQPQITDHTNRAQDGFDILFDHEKFISEIEVVKAKYEVISSDWKQKIQLWEEDHIDESVSLFIWQYGERSDDKEIVMDDVLRKASYPLIFNEFIFIELGNYLRQKLTITEDQQSKISALVSDWVDNIARCSNIHLLAQLIDSYNIELTDVQLLSLLPYSYVAIKTKTPNGLWDNGIDKSLLQHIYDKTSDKKLVVAEIDHILSDSEHLSPPLFEKLADLIVREKIEPLYKYFEKMLFVEVEEGWQGGYYSDSRLRIADTILKIGQKGLQILDSLKGKFSDHDRLYYYQMILSEDALKLQNETEIAADIHKIHNKATSENEKELALSLLSKLGDADGLTLIVDYYGANPDCFRYNTPILLKYGSEHIDLIKHIFEISYTLDAYERSEMRNRAFNWLNTFGLQSSDNRDAIIAYYRQLSEADPVNYSYLHRVSKNLYNKYFEDKSPAMSITDSVELFASIK